VVAVVVAAVELAPAILAEQVAAQWAKMVFLLTTEKQLIEGVAAHKQQRVLMPVVTAPMLLDSKQHYWEELLAYTDTVEQAGADTGEVQLVDILNLTLWAVVVVAVDIFNPVQ
jgi:hypothetical protein